MFGEKFSFIDLNGVLDSQDYFILVFMHRKSKREVSGKYCTYIRFIVIVRLFSVIAGAALHSVGD